MSYLVANYMQDEVERGGLADLKHLSRVFILAVVKIFFIRFSICLCNIFLTSQHTRKVRKPV